MREKQNLYQGVSHAAWGCVFLYFNINLGTVNILPKFVGYLLFLSAITLLREEQRDLALLRPLAIALAVWNGIQWGMECFAIPTGKSLMLLALIANVVELYFNFQFFTDFAALAAKYQQPEDELDKRLLKWRTVQTVVFTLLMVMENWNVSKGSVWMAVIVTLMLAGLAAGLWLMTALFSLRKLFEAY